MDDSADSSAPLKKEDRAAPDAYEFPTQKLNYSDSFKGQILPTSDVGGNLTWTAQIHSGPLPSAAQFKAYKEVDEAAAQWILNEAAKSADHVRAVELEGVRIQKRDALLSRMLPFAVVITFLAVFAIVSFANVWIGAAGLAATLASVVLAYLRPFGTHSGPQFPPASSLNQRSTSQAIPTQSPPTPGEHREQI